jgi:AcrR family transcriptional regulator
MSTESTRRYRLKRRAEAQHRTRRRITEAAVDLHGSVGPARTSISAVAELAGVQRATVYRHFPDEASLFAACSQHWLSQNPPPDPTQWRTIEDPDERLRQGLSELYAYYGRTEAMVSNLLRDEPAVAVLRPLMAARRSRLGGMADALLAGRSVRGRRRREVRAALGHAVAFETWRSLVRHQGLAEERAVELMARLVGRPPAAARASPPGSPVVAEQPQTTAADV